MTWVRIDDNAPHHRKLRAAGPEAAWLWVAGLAHCNRFTTDGRIEELDLDVLYPFPGWDDAKLRALAKTLVKVGLWDAVDGGWQVHHYEDFQAEAMRSARDERREWERQRKANQRAAAKGKRVETAAPETMSHRDRAGTGVGQPLGHVPPLSHGCPSLPSRPVPSQPQREETRGRETLRAPDPAPQAPLFDDAEEPVAPKAKATRALARDGAEKAPGGAATGKPAFRVADALEALSAASGGKVARVEGRDVAKGHAVSIALAIKAYPDPREWQVCGEWLAAGGERSKVSLGVSWVASGALRDAMAASRAWSAAGRPALLDARGFPVVAASVGASPAPADTIDDVWARAEREAWDEAKRKAAVNA